MKKIIAMVLAMVMTMSLLPILEVSAAENVTYIDAVVDSDTNKVTYEEKSIAEYTIVTSSTTSMSNGWYVVAAENVSVWETITVSGEVNLVLCDGATLSANKSIILEKGARLNIFAQSEDETMMGKMIATANKEYYPGIGWYGVNNESEADGKITINGGNINSRGRDYGAGIGGGDDSNGYVTINGGIVTATSGGFGAGIGGGDDNNGYVTINGGTVTATGGLWAAGIGGGDDGNGYVTINGGTVTATGGDVGAGIGGGSAGTGEVTISGGTVTATGVGSGAGIGGSNDGSGTVTIYGGTVTATGGNFAAGIGGGSSGTGEVTISGGTVTATGGKYGAGIGGGKDGSGTVTIDGGTVTATGGIDGPGIGCGGAFDSRYVGDGYVTIDGGNVKALAGDGAEAIGKGKSGTLKNAADEDISLRTYTLDGVKEEKEVKSTDGINYGIKDVKTLDTNKLYFYLPSNAGNLTKVTMRDTQTLVPKTEGDSTFYCTHAKVSDSYCVYCGEYMGCEQVDGVYQISHLDDLDWFANVVNSDDTKAKAVLLKNVDMSEVYNENGKSRTAIGTYDKPFEGTFDGNGHEITGLYIKAESSFAGLFGAIDGGEVKNLTLKGEIDIAARVDNVGGLTGYAKNNTNIENVTVEMEINDVRTGVDTTIKENRLKHVGGVVASLENSTMKNVSCKGEVTLQVAETVGGLVGIASSNSAMSYCTNYATVTLNGNSAHVAGIAGDAQTGTNVSYCINYGNVTTSVTDCVGGVAGYANENVKIENCANIGEICYNGTGKPYMGGILGYINNSGFKGISNSYNYGKIASKGDAGNSGAIIGWNRDSKNVYSDNFYSKASCKNAYGPDANAIAATAFEKEAFESGEAAYLFAKSWGQTLTGDNADKYPVFLNDDNKVYKVTFEVSGKEYAVKYANKSGVSSMPEEPSDENYIFKCWSTTKSTNGDMFTEKTNVNADMTVYAVKTEKTVASDVSDKFVYKFGENVEINLNDLVKNASGNDNDFVFELKTGSSLPTWLSFEDGKIEGVARDAGEYSITFTIRNNGILLMSLNDECDELTITITVENAINYLDAVVDSQTSSVTMVKKYIKDFNTVTENTTVMSNGWYAVTENVTVESKITIDGTVNLILGDGVTLSVKDGIELSGDNALKIYAQSKNDETMGKLITESKTTMQSGIGLGYRQSGGAITINGGMLNSTGGGRGSGIECATVTINAGTVITQGGIWAAGISGTVMINGGTVTATGGSCGAGIGGGYETNGGAVTINGGTLTAKGGTSAAGIGGGSYANGGTVLINGGNVRAIGGYKSESIGKGQDGTDSGTLKNSNENDVSLKIYTLDGVDEQKSIESIVGINYGVNDVKTLDENKLYFYLPSNAGNLTKVTMSDTQTLAPKTEGDTTLYCTHAKVSESYCEHCGTKFAFLGTANDDGSYSLPENVVGYYINDKFVDAGCYEIEENDVVVPVDFNVEIVNGAQVRYGAGVNEEGKVNDGNGLRFIAQVDKSNFDGITYGMKIQAEESDNSTEVVADKWQDDDKTVFTVAITNLATSNYNRNYTATPFVKVRYDDGSEKTVYGTKTVTRSIYYVASGLLKNGVNEEDYTLTGNATLYNVLNAYVNMVGIRLNIENDGTMTPNTTDKGKYSGDAFFEVTCVKNENVYSVTIKPVSEEFENPVKIMGYWKEFIRINNNNSTVRNMITNEQIASDGTLTFDFTMEAKESNN